MGAAKLLKSRSARRANTIPFEKHNSKSLFLLETRQWCHQKQHIITSISLRETNARFYNQQTKLLFRSTF